MAFQTSVYIKQAIGMEGEFYDDSPRRVSPYIVKTNTGDISAKGGFTFSANPADGDTVTVGSVTYKFMDTLAAANDIKRGADQAASMQTLAAVLNGTAASGTDYFTGTTTPSADVSAAIDGNDILLTAKTAGTAGNSVALAATGSAVATSGAALDGGLDDTTIYPYIGCVFTAGDQDKVAVIGGTGEFRGIAVNPKNYPFWGGLKASLAMVDGVPGQLCRMGVLFVRVMSAVAPDYVGIYNAATGEISGMQSGGSVPAGFKAIPNAVFKFFSAAAGEVAVLQLTD